jgi:hypothetical protein
MSLGNALYWLGLLVGHVWPCSACHHPRLFPRGVYLTRNHIAAMKVFGQRCILLCRPIAIDLAF